MDRIESPEQYKELLRSVRARLPEMDTNCFLMARAMEPYILENRLFAREFPDGLAVYADEGKYFTLYYFWRRNAPFGELRAPRPVEIVELNSAGRRDENILRVERHILAAGFSPFKFSHLLEADVENALRQSEEYVSQKLPLLEKEGLRVLSPVTEEFVPGVIALWERELDVTDIPADHRDFVRRPSDQVICLADGDGTVASAYWWRTGKTAAEGRHIVTDPRYARRGYARLLLALCIRSLHRSGVRTLSTYVSRDNTGSLELHKKTGFRVTDRNSRSYLLR